MSKSTILIGLAVVVVIALGVLVDTRLAAGAGALLLLLGIGYGTWQAKRATPQEDIRGERGARELREELAEDEARRGTR